MENDKKTDRTDTSSASGDGKKKVQKQRREFKDIPMTSMEDFYAGTGFDSGASSGVVTFGFGSDTAHPAVSETAEDTAARMETAGRSPESGPSVRSRRRVREADTVSPSCHIVASVRTRDLLSLYVKAYNGANPGAKKSMKEMVDEAVGKYLKKLSPDIYAKAIGYLESLK